MTTLSDADALLAAYLADGMDVLPDRVVDAVLDEVTRTRQRSVLGSWRTRSVFKTILGAAAVVAVLVVGGVAWSGGLRLGVGTPSPAPSTSPSPLPSASANPSPSASPTAVPPAIRPSGPLPRNGMLAVGRDDAILLIDPDTGKTVRRLSVPDPLVTDITWAPDGERLAFTSAGGVWVMELANETPRKIMSCGDGPDACSIAWSPDGVAIAVAHGHRVELIDPDNGETAVMHVFVDWAFEPTWSPDGARVAVMVSDIDASDQRRRLIAIDRDGSDWAVIRGPDNGMSNQAWSPDGSTIAYFDSTEVQVCSTPQECVDGWQVHVMALPLGGAQPRELREVGVCGCIGVGPDLTWSPNGSSLALVVPPSDERGDFGLFRLNADGTDFRQLADGHAWAPAWQPIP